MLTPSDELDTMIAAARAAGSDLLRRFRALPELHVELKGPADFVSDADLESERRLRSILLGAYPDFGFLAEESAPTAGRGGAARFVVDPLDGTSNFIHGVPHFAVSIALEREGRVVAGVVFDVPKDELFFAEQGQGAWLERERLRVCDDADLSRVLVASGIPHSNRATAHEGYLRMLGAAMREAAGIRRMAAAALDMAYVAAGRFGAYFELGLARWDVAAGLLLVSEAGGRVSRPDGGPDVLGTGDVLATNGRLHEPMLALLRQG